MKALPLRFIGAALLGAASFSAMAEIDVMTQNQYLGADLAPVLGAPDAGSFNAAVVDALTKIAATRPAARTRALADEIAQRNPDVVGLQEAFKFACQPYPGFPAARGKGCDDAVIKGAFTNHLRDTEAALRGRFIVAGKVTNLQVAEIPFAVNGYWALLTVVDRDAILVRKGLRASAVNFTGTALCRPSDDGCNYQTVPKLPTAVGEITIERGFVAVDVTVKGQTYRVFNTHLEIRQLAPSLPETRLLQVGQAYELLGTALGTWDGKKRVIVVGDFNSDPRDTIPAPPYPATLPWAPSLPVIPPYWVFAANGFTDAWTLRQRSDEGLTCCQAEDLTNRKSALYERIDLIFSLTPPSRVQDARLLGKSQDDKTRPSTGDGLWSLDHAAYAEVPQLKPISDTAGDSLRPSGSSGLWPSDHAALAATLKFD